MRDDETKNGYLHVYIQGIGSIEEEEEEEATLLIPILRFTCLNSVW